MDGSFGTDIGAGARATELVPGDLAIGRQSFPRSPTRPIPARIARASNAGSIRKRAFDVGVGLTALALLSPMLLAIWLMVRFTSRGPGLYWSERVGRYQRLFWMPKFRTMAAGAPVVSRELLADAHCHLTPLGKILRRWSLDELPQLLCIVKGDMSFIGPRPLIPSDPAQLAREAFPVIQAARPGLSGLAQIRGRNHVSPRRKARLDACYARARTGRLDLEIFARTVAVMVTGTGFL